MKHSANKRGWLISLLIVALLLATLLTVTAVAAARTNKIAKINLVLNEDIDILFWADISESTARADGTYVTFNDGAPVTFDSIRTESSVAYAVFRYADILPQDMHGAVTAKLYVGGQLTDTRTYSVKEYCQYMLVNSSNAKLKTLVSDLLTYGAASQAYIGEDETEYATYGVTGLTPSAAPSTITVSAPYALYDNLSRTEQATTHAFGLALKNSMGLYFDVSIQGVDNIENYTGRLFVNGREETAAFEALNDGSGRYRATFYNIQAGEFFDEVKFGVYKDGRRISRTVGYSVAQYIESINEDPGASDALLTLTDAIYNYGMSAHKYVGDHILKAPGTVTGYDMGSSSKDDYGTLGFTCTLCGQKIADLWATHIRTFSSSGSNSNGSPANNSIFNITRATETLSGKTNGYMSVLRGSNTAANALGYYFTVSNSDCVSGTSYIDGSNQYTGSAFAFQFDVRSPAGGLAPTTFNFMNTNKASDPGRWTRFIEINTDGSITINSTTVAPAGTVNTSTWTNILVMMEFCELGGEDMIYLEFYINGAYAAAVPIANTLYNGKFTQMHMAVNPTNLTSTMGVQLDNFVFAQGAAHSYTGTVEEHIEKSEQETLLELIDLIDAEFDITDFSTVVDATVNGSTVNRYEREQATFLSLDTNKYADPLAYPTEGQHPRLLFTSSDIPGILAAMKNPENAAAATTFKSLAGTSTTGVLVPIENVTETATQHLNFNDSVLAIIQAKAFYYAIYKDDPTVTDAELRGYQAIYAMKNFLLTMDIQWKASDQCRLFGHAMYATALVYDWCYDLLTEADRDQLMLGVQNLCCDGVSNEPDNPLVTHHGLKMESGFPPQSEQQTPLTGHGAEFQILRDYLSFAIAIYDENDTWYDYIGGLIYQDYVPVRNYFYTSGFYPDGSAVYNNYRYLADLWSAWMLDSMGAGVPYNAEDMQTIVHGLMAMETYDGEQFATGDGTAYSVNTGRVDIPGGVSDAALISSFLFEDSAARAIALRDGRYLSRFYTGQSNITSVDYLILSSNGVETGDDYQAKINNVEYHGGFQQQVITRSSKDANQVTVLMQGGQRLPGGHTHRNAGNFQIYYKGFLTLDDGLYDSYGYNHHFYYHMSATAHNTLLIYNPALASTMNGYYNGGQKRDLGVPYDYETWLESDNRFLFGKNIGLAYDSETDPTYVYFANDLTLAYDNVTVDYVERSITTVYTGDANVPMVMFIFDHIDADDPTFQKTFLLQCAAEPAVNGKTVTVDLGTGKGKMVLTSLKGGDTIKAYGRGSVNGEVVPGGTSLDERFYLSGAGKNLAPAGAGSLSDQKVDKGSVWGHVEIQPATGNKTDLMMNVIYVTDSGKTVAYTPTLVESNSVTGATFGSFTSVNVNEPSNADKQITFTTSGNGTMTYYVGGVEAGDWKVSVGGSYIGTYSTNDSEHLLTFRAPVGEVTLSPVGLIDFDYTQGGTLSNYQNGVGYGAGDGTTGKGTYSIVGTAGNAYLLWSSTGATPQIQKAGAYGSVCNGKKAISFEITLGQDGSNALLSTNLYMRYKDPSTNAQTDIPLMYIKTNGSVVFGSAGGSVEFANLSDGTTKTLRFVIDFEKAKLMAYDANGSLVASGNLSSYVALPSGFASYEAWFENFTNTSNYLFAWGARAAGNLRIYKFGIYAGNLFSNCANQPANSAAHSYDSGTVITAASTSNCTPGLRRYTCQDCGITKDELIASTKAHTLGASSYGDNASINGECGTTCTLSYKCTVCGYQAEYVDAVRVLTFDDGCTCGTVACINASAIDYSSNKLSLIGAFNTSNANITNNVDVKLIGAGGGVSALANPQVAYLGFDVVMPSAGFSEGGIALNVKLGVANGSSVWANTGLSFQNKKINYSYMKKNWLGRWERQTGSITATAGTVYNVVVKLDVSTTGTARYDVWINGEYKGYNEVSHNQGAWSLTQDANTYTQLTISRNDSNTNANRGIILDNIFVSNTLPNGLSTS